MNETLKVYELAIAEWRGQVLDAWKLQVTNSAGEWLEAPSLVALVAGDRLRASAPEGEKVLEGMLAQGYVKELSD